MNNQWFSKVAVWLVIAMVLFTVFKQFDTRTGMGAGAVGYSEFLEDVRQHRIKSATIQEARGAVPRSWPSPTMTAASAPRPPIWIGA